MGSSPRRDGGPLDGAVIAFDLDGTLVDSAPDLVATLNAILRQEGHAALPMEEGRSYIGHGARRLLQRGLAASGCVVEGEALDLLFGRFLAYYEAHIADGSRPFPGVVDALGELRGAGARLVVCTNKLTHLSVALIGALGMAEMFEAVVGADQAPAAKPDPRHLETAVRAAGGSLDRAVMVGDAAPDAGAARAAGVPLVLVSFGYSQSPVAELEPDILIDRFDQLPDACLRLLGACEA